MRTKKSLALLFATALAFAGCTGSVTPETPDDGSMVDDSALMDDVEDTGDTATDDSGTGSPMMDDGTTTNETEGSGTY